MTHTVDGQIHKITDEDKHFLIDIESKRITHPTETLPVLVQNDHNSERLSFDISKIIDGHDVTTCNLVQIHFINTDKDNVENFNSSIYEVKDLKAMPGDNTKATFTWLIDQAGTHLAGPLTFAIQFACTHMEEGTDDNGNPIVKTVLDYAWNTHPFIGINVSDGMNNEEVLSDQYYSAVDAWTETIKYYGTEAQNAAVAEIKATTAKSKSEAIESIDKHVSEVKRHFTGDVLDINDVIIHDINEQPSDNKVPSSLAVSNFVQGIDDSIREGIQNNTSELLQKFNQFKQDIITSAGSLTAIDVGWIQNDDYEFSHTSEKDLIEELFDNRSLADTYMLYPTTYYEIRGDIGETLRVYMLMTYPVFGDSPGNIVGYRYKAYEVLTGVIGEDYHKVVFRPIGVKQFTILDNNLYSITFVYSLNDTICETTIGQQPLSKLEDFDAITLDDGDYSELFVKNNIAYIPSNVTVYECNDPRNVKPYIVQPNGIHSIEATGADRTETVYTILLDNGDTYDFIVPHGVSIDDIILDEEGDYENTFSIELSDGKSKYFKIPNGNSAGVKTELSGPIIRADNVIPVNHKVKTSLRSKNMIKPRYTSNTSIDGITVIPNADGHLTIEGETTGRAVIRFINTDQLYMLKPGTYTLSVGNNIPNITDCYIIVEDYINGKWNSRVSGISAGQNSCTFTVDHEMQVACYLQIPKGVQVDTLDLYPQLEEGDTATPYTPYVDLSTVTLTRYGKNIIPYPHAHGTGSSYGVNYTSNSDGTVTATGTATENSLLYMATQSQGPIHLVPGVYTLSGCPAGGSHSTYRITIKVPGAEQYYHDYGEGCTFEVTEDIWVEIYMFIGTGTTANALVFKPQLEVGSEATPYEPYTATTHKSTSDGILVTTPRSVAPTMTLLTNKPGVIIDTVYNRDQSVIFTDFESMAEEFTAYMEEANEGIWDLVGEFDEATTSEAIGGNIPRRDDKGNIILPDQTRSAYAPGANDAVSRAFVEKHTIAKNAPITMSKWIEDTPYTYSTKVDYDGVHVTDDEDGGVYSHTCYKASCIEYKDRDGNTIATVSLPKDDGDDYDIELATLKDIKALNATYSGLISDLNHTISDLQSEITNLWDRITALETNLAKGDQTS